MKPNLLNDDSVDASGGMLVVLGATVLALGAKSRQGADGAGRGNSVGKERTTVAGATMMPLLAGSSGGAAAVAWILVVLVWRCRRVCQTFSSLS